MQEKINWKTSIKWDGKSSKAKRDLGDERGQQITHEFVI